MKLITFSLWGSEEKYCIGAIRNAELVRSVYPGWKARFYVGDSVPTRIKMELRCHTDEVILMEEPGDWRGMFWRFYPASEDDVDVFISRDCDSRLSAREAAAVNEWLQGPKLIHVMRDHPEHSAPIMGGMWGAKRGALPNIQAQIQEYVKGDFWQVDQNFLKDVVWPANYHKVLAHDDWRRFPIADTKPFPTPREDNDFIGSIIGPDGNRLHPEHHEAL
jgi:hypothetical protein